MPDCECLPKCAFFNDKMGEKPALADMMKLRYCKKDSSGCARHMVKVALGADKVPMDLYPSQVDRAKKIISSK